jgi:hypothetical protein
MRNREKLHELILHIAWANQGDPEFATARLAKDLFCADFERYRLSGKAITGSDYLAMPGGPLLDGLQGILEGMQAKRMLLIEGRPNAPFMQQRPIPLREPNLALFTRDELAVIDSVIAECREQTAATVSRESHDLPGWRYTRHGEHIPYASAWLSDPEPTEDERRRAHALAVRLGRG